MKQQNILHIHLKTLLPLLMLMVILLLTGFVYLPGLHGGFLFDDYPNLGVMAQFGDMDDWKAAKAYVTHGIAGPSGRPIALASFLLNAHDWPRDAFGFKLVNLYIHLLCGLLLCWVSLLLLRAYGYTEKKATWVAILTSGLWLLHPLMLSTTLYVVQRMTQLAMLFGLIGILGYLQGRTWVTTKPKLAYTLMTMSIGLGTLLATFSKENGALLPFLILIIEFCNPIRDNKPIWYWRAACLWLPSFAILIKLCTYIDFSENPWPNRHFNQVERLLSESRIVCDYLIQLFVPRIEGHGLFQDGYVISTDWLSPPSTLISCVFLLILLMTGFIARKKYPLLALAILFYFAAHLMESTVIGLELYFEHRNYIAAMFLFMPLATCLYMLSEHTKSSLSIFITCLVITVLAWMTWQRAMLWSDSYQLQAYWAQHSPNSARAQSYLAQLLVLRNQHDDANKILERAILTMPENSSLSIQLLQQKIESGEVKQEDFDKIQHQILKQRADAQAILAIQDLVQHILNKQELVNAYGDDIVNILDILMEKNQSYRQYPKFIPWAMLCKAQIFTAEDKQKEAYQEYSKILNTSHNIDDGLSIVVNVSNFGKYQLALSLLDLVDQIYQKQPNKDLKYSRAYYDKYIANLKNTIQTNINATENKHRQ